MEKRLQRDFRDRQLTPEERASDVEVRRKVEQEFPPSRSAAIGSPSSLSELLRRSIRECSKSVEEIAEDAHVSPVVVARFLTGERDIHMTTADKLADTLGLKLASE